MNTILITYSFYNFLDKFLAHTLVNIFNINLDSLPLTNVPFLISYSIPITFNVIFFIILLSLFWRLKSLSGLFENYKFSSRKELKMFTKIFDQISETINFINRFYIFNTVGSLLDLLVISINITYLAYDIIVNSRNPMNFLIVAGACNYIFTSGLICILIIAYSSFIQNLQDTIIFKINGLGTKCSDLKNKKFSLISTMHISTLKNEISCEFFVFNWKHLFVMISSYFSYVIVTVQFDFMINTN